MSGRLPNCASVTFRCGSDGRVVPDLWADPHSPDPGDQNAIAIERLVRVAMRAQGAHREAIEAAVNAAERAQKEGGAA
jgi:hypothetical protein